ncbi:MAG: CinA family protein [Pseudomonadota bacterium]
MALAERTGAALLRQGRMLATAESCTGGGVAHALTAVAGSSGWFERGFVTYSNEAKREMLGVRPETLQTFGAVSEATVREMAEGALRHSRAQVSLSISGIAGPSGGSADKPVGMVCFGWAMQGRPTRTRTEYFSGDRAQVREQAVRWALEGLLDVLDQPV